MFTNVFRCLIFILVIASFTNFNSAIYAEDKISQPLVKNGEINLRGIDFDESELINIEGEWEFYWNKLLSPKDFSRKSVLPTGYFNYGVWKNKVVNKVKIFERGYATYRVKLKLDNKKRRYGILIKKCLSACKLFVDGQAVVSIGRVGVDKDSSIPRTKPATYNFISNKVEIEVILQVSNFHETTRRGLSPIRFGSRKKIIYSAKTALVEDALLIGILFTMAIYHILRYLFKSGFQGGMPFAVFCIIIAARTAISGDAQIASTLLLDVSVVTLWKVQNMVFYSVMPIFVNFAWQMYPDEYSNLFHKVLWIIAPFFIITTILTSPQFNLILEKTYVVITAYSIASLFWSQIKACVNRRESSLIFMAALALCGISVVADILSYMRIYRLPSLTHYGVIILVFAQAIIIARRSSKFFQKLALTTKNNAQLKELDRQKTHFFQNISHELRTPLTLIMNPLEEAYVKYKDDTLEMALNNSKRLYRLVNQLLDFQKASGGKLKLELENINLSKFVISISNYFKDIRNEKQVSFSHEIPDSSDLYILGEIDALEKIVFNYLSNALKYSHKYGKILLKMKRVDDAKVRISVHNSGMGISGEDQSKLFKVFSQVDGSASREFEGTGLGLALVKELTEKMNGQVGVKSTVNKETIFYVEFPIVKKVKQDVDLLIVDDEPEISTLIERHCLSKGLIQVQIAHNAKVARKLLKVSNFKCIVSDLFMPGEDGISLLTHVNEVQPNARKILITGKGSAKDITKVANDVKVDKIILKPISVTDIESTIMLLINEYDSVESNVVTDKAFDFSEYKPKEWHLVENQGSNKSETEENINHIEGSGELILVIDDLKDMRTLISKSLLKKKYRVVTAVDGVDGLEKAKEYNPDVIITDWMMPRKSGIDLISDLKDDNSLAHIPTILLTAKSDDDSRSISTKTGANAYIGKPFDELELMSTVENLLRLKTKEQEVVNLNKELSENVLKRFLPPALVDSIVAGESKFDNSYKNQTITIMFTDLCSFSKLSDEIGPQIISRMLNTYLVEMTDIVFDHGGTIDKIIGDALMIFWGAPEKLDVTEQVKRAYECSLSINCKLKELNKVWIKDGLPELNHRIGVHHGPAIVGYFGGQRRSDYTAIGTTINKTQRIESSAEPGTIYVSDVVRDLLPSESKWEKAGIFSLKGFTSKEVLYKIIL